MGYPAKARLSMIMFRVNSWSGDVLREVQLDDRIDKKKVAAFQRAAKKMIDVSRALDEEIESKKG